MTLNLGSFSAVVDIGSNSVKFILFEQQREVPQNPRTLKVIDQGSYVTRLGKGTSESGFFADESINATQKALREIKTKIGEGVSIRAFATESARKVKDISPLVEIIKKELNCDLTVLTGQQEADLSTTGAIAAAFAYWPKLNKQSTIFPFIEIGGGSTQFGFIHGSDSQSLSIPFGAVNIFEKLKLPNEGFNSNDWQVFRDKIKSMLDHLDKSQSIKNLAEKYKKFSKEKLTVCPLGIGGSLLLAAKILNSSNKIDDQNPGLEIDKQSFLKSAQELALKSVSDRLNISLMDAGRADILPAGLLLFFVVADILDLPDSIFITSWGLRHGIAINS